MPAFFAWLSSVLATFAGELVVRGLVGAGVAFATYKFVVAPVREQITARLGAAGELSHFVGWLGIDVAVTIVLSAWLGRTAVSAGKAFLTRRAP